MKCPKCRYDIPSGATVCVYCGTGIAGGPTCFSWILVIVCVAFFGYALAKSPELRNRLQNIRFGRR